MKKGLRLVTIFYNEMTQSLPQVKLLSPEKKKQVETKKAAVDLERKINAHIAKPKTQASMMSFFKKK